MVRAFTNLLDSKKFWSTLGWINFISIFLVLQPMVLAASGVVVVFLASLRLLAGIAGSRRTPKIAALCVLVVCFFLTVGGVSLALQNLGVSTRSDSGMLTVLLLTSALWGTVLLTPRIWRWSRARAAAEALRQAAEREAELRTAAQRRRESARTHCELLYSACAPEIAKRFPRSAFDAFVAAYLGDSLPPEYVEERAKQLCALIDEHRRKADPAAKKMSLADLAAWFLREKQQIDASPLDDEDKASLTAQLEGRYAKLQEKHIRSMEP